MGLCRSGGGNRKADQDISRSSWRCFSLAWSHQGRYLVSGGYDDATVQVWEAATGNTRTVFKGQSGAILSLSWSPDDKQIVSASQDGSLQVWEALSGKSLFQVSPSPLYVLGQ